MMVSFAKTLADCGISSLYSFEPSMTCLHYARRRARDCHAPKKPVRTDGVFGNHNPARRILKARFSMAKRCVPCTSAGDTGVFFTPRIPQYVKVGVVTNLSQTNPPLETPSIKHREQH